MMTIKEKLLQEVESFPDYLLTETLDFVLFLKSRYLMPCVSDDEQADLEDEFGSPANYADEELVDMTNWVKYGSQVS